MFAASAAMLLALIFFASAPNPVSSQTSDCGPLMGGLLQDCSFKDFYGDIGACSGVWKCTTPGGIGLIEGEGWRSGPSIHMLGDGPFDKSIYQHVAVTPGKGYCASVPFFVVKTGGSGWQDGDPVNRRVGIDPFGGSDPNAPSVRWSGDFFGKGRFDDGAIYICEYARMPTITVFLRVNNDIGDRHVDVFIDSPSLVENTSMTPIEVAPPTPTPAPTEPPPTPRPTSEPTAAPPPTEPPPPTELPEPTAEPTAVVEPSAIPPATETSIAQAPPTTRPTRVRIAMSDASGDPDPPATPGSALGLFAIVGVVGIGSAVVLSFTAAFLLLRRK
jgi:hypothetical protein